MELRVLRYFLAVAREESITGAAESLHITQPTLSKQLMDLEAQLGKKLFIRGNRKITLTEEGLFLRSRAQEIIDLVDKTESDILMPDEIVSGDVYIGGGESAAMRLIAKTAKNLHADYPQIRHHLFSGSADDVMERLDKGLLDFGILLEPADIQKYDFLRLPASDTWGVLMRKDSPLASLDYFTPEHMWNIPLLCSRRGLVRNQLSGWLGDELEKLNIVATFNLIYNAALMVEEGFGYALCLDKLVNTEGSSLCFRPLKPRIDCALVVVWKKYQFFSKSAKKFIEKLQEELK